MGMYVDKGRNRIRNEGLGVCNIAIERYIDKDKVQRSGIKF